MGDADVPRRAGFSRCRFFRPPRRRLPHPEIFLEVSTGCERWLDERPAGLEEAVAHVAEFLQEQVIDDVFGAWPVCSGWSSGIAHAHPMAVDLSDAACWVCPAGGDVRVEIGSLPPLR